MPQSCSTKNRKYIQYSRIFHTFAWIKISRRISLPHYAVLPKEKDASMGEPQYRLEGIVHTKAEIMEDFEGPLDVIFEVLSKNKIEIQDVSITAILEQYLGYLDEMKRMDMEIASEFITMASHLMLIKTKMLLSAAEAAEAESELDLLRQSLVERKRKEAMEQIRKAVA